MKKFLIISLLTAVCWSMVGGAAFAQSPQVYCGDLSDEDCAILTDAVAASTELNSVATDGSVTVLIENIPDAPVDTVDFELVATSVSSVDPEAVMELLEIQESYAKAPADNMPAMLEATAEVYSTAKMASDMTLNTTAEVAEQIALLSGVEVPESVSISLAIVDELGYVDLSEVAPIFPDEAWQEALDGWHAVNLVELLNEFSAKIEEADQADMSAADPNAMAMAMMMGDDALLQEFVVVERLEDDNDMAVFQSSFDFAGFLGSPLFREMVLTQMEMDGTKSAAELEEMESTLTMMGFMAPVIVEGVEAGTVRTVSLDDGYLHNEESYFNWDLSSLATIAGIVGADADLPIDTENPPMISIGVSNNYSGFNEEITVSAPEEYLFYPTEGVMKALEDSNK